MHLKMNWLLIVGCFAGSLIFNSFACSQSPSELLSDVAETKLQTLSGESIPLTPKQGFLVVSFLGIECPLAKLYAPRINQLATEFKSQGFEFVAVNSNRQDSTQEWRQFAKTTNLVLPIVKDHGNQIADKLNVVRNPDVVVIDSDGKIRYLSLIHI